MIGASPESKLMKEMRKYIFIYKKEKKEKKKTKTKVKTTKQTKPRK